MPKDIAQEFLTLPKDVHSGTLKFFGAWFGRPMDNVHTPVSAVDRGGKLEVRFDQNETLEIWEPSGLAVDGRTLRIPKAKKVKWSWYYYGRPQTPENLLFEEFEAIEGRVLVRTNSPFAIGEVRIHEPAVEIY